MLSKLIYRINIVLVFISLFVYLSPYVDVAILWPISLLALFYPFLLLLNVLFIIYWGIKKEKKLLLSLGWLILGWSHFHSLVGLSFGRGNQTKDYIEILSYNCRGFRTDNQRGNIGSFKEVIQFLNDKQIKIACLQEFPLSKQKESDQLIDQLAKKTNLKYTYRINNSGLLILSYFPLKGIKTKHFTKNNHFNGFQYADITLDNNRKIRLFNIHLQTNAVTHIAGKLAQQDSYQDKETWLTIKGMMGRYRRSAISRIKQAKEIQVKIQESPYPVIVCGDFNDVPLSRTYHLLKGNLQDGFTQEGRGLGITYAESIPGLKIDYTFYSNDFDCTFSKVHHQLFSDHYPISCRLKLTNPH